jgi:HEAT repeat protein
MTFFCPKCWREVPPASLTCPHCRAQLAEEDAKPFVEKLRSALRHREPETAARAAWILGERREVSAVADLIYVLKTSQDGFLAESAAEALGKIGDPSALPMLEHALVSGQVRVRGASRRAIESIRRRLARPGRS